MKLTSKDLYEMKVIDKIIKEPKQIDEKEFLRITENIKNEIVQEIKNFEKMNYEEIIENRYNKFRNISGFMEV